jgi:hypothetical protein
MPFSPNRIKFEINEKLQQTTSHDSISELVSSWGLSIQQFSMCINNAPRRVYPQLRILISNFIGRPVEQVFGRHPLTDALLARSERKQRRVA